MMEGWALFPEALAGSSGWLLILASAGTSFLTAAFGIGGGVLMLAIMAVLMPAQALIPVHGVVQIGSNAGRAMIMIQQVQWALLLPFCAGSVVGAVVGGMTVIELPPHLLQIGLGCFILYSVWGKLPKANGRFAVVLTGAFSTFLTMFFGATGPFVAAMVKARKLGRLEHVATHATCMVAQHVVKVATFGLLGFAYGSYLPLIVAMIASGFAGTFLGRNFLVKLEDDSFHKILSFILSALALQLVYKGIFGG